MRAIAQPLSFVALSFVALSFSVVLFGTPVWAQGQPPDTQPAPPPAATTPGVPPPAQPVPQPLPTAGGLTAPPPIDPSKQAANSETQTTLDKSKEDDSGRGLTVFWMEADGGFQHVGLETFEVDAASLSAGFVESSASGGYVGVGLGVQLVWFRLGPRARVGFFKDFNMWSIGGEVGVRFPLGPIEPYIQLGGGYTALGGLEGGFSVVPTNVNISGFHFRVGGGLDFFLGDVVSIGATATWEFMGLTRPGVSLEDLNASQVDSLDEAQQKALAAEGSGYGSAISIGGKLGLSF